MNLQIAVELILAAGAALLLARDLRRAWRDPLRRPVSLLMASLVAVLLIGVVGGQSHPSPWWLLVPGSVLVWEVVRGWRVVPRCHLREAGIGAFAASLVLAAFGLGIYEESMSSVLLAEAALMGAAALGLFALSHRREPRPWRTDDVKHYERRASRRPKGTT
ncbi:MAG TPA: hypothetical protein VFR66_05440 [Burkholderiales bacterium]|nr:hypothetical protein [Burkholderiales bacterium]